MNKKLSIIIPCYNCAGTLKEAVDSVYTQNLIEPFEIVMVNDHSTDRTLEVMGELARTHTEIRYFSHEKNRGGGATRNTAIKSADGELIFVLDGDDILPPGMLKRLMETLQEKKSDGVVFGASHYFRKSTHKTKIKENSYGPDEKILFENLFQREKGYITMLNFMYTKKSWEVSGGYPEHHGFDTGSFGFRFLLAGHHAYVSPGTYYFHRQAQDNSKSYFERMYEKGELSRNTYLINEDIMFLLSPFIRREILNFDIFKRTGTGDKSLTDHLDPLYKQSPQKYFVQNYKQYLCQNGFEKYVETNKNSNNPMDTFCSAIYDYQKSRYSEALRKYEELIKLEPTSTILYFNSLRCLLGLSQACDKAEIENRVDSLANSLILKKQGSLFVSVPWWKMFLWRVNSKFAILQKLTIINANAKKYKK